MAKREERGQQPGGDPFVKGLIGYLAANGLGARA